MGAHQSKPNKRRAHGSSTKQQQPPPQPPQPVVHPPRSSRQQLLRSQQLQQQRHRATVRQPNSPSSRHLVPEQPPPSQLPVAAPFTTSEPLLMEDDDDDDDEEEHERRRLSIDFFESHSSILLKGEFSAAAAAGDSRFSSITSLDRHASANTNNGDELLFLPPTLSSIASSSSSSSSSARTALFSTLSSLSSTASSVSSVHHMKQDATLPILEGGPASTLSLPTTTHSSSSSTVVVDDSRMDEAFDALDRWINDSSGGERAASGVVEAYYPYAVFHYYGLSPTRQPNYALAYKYFQQAAKENRALLQTCRDREQRERMLGIISNAQYNLGEMWASGKGVARPNVDKAAKYFAAAAENGHATAQYTMGQLLQHKTAGKVEADDDTAVQWYTRAAEQGHAKAQAALGVLLLDRAPQEALKWLRRAADQEDGGGGGGDTHASGEALLQLAYVYEEGLVVARDKRRAFEYYERYLRRVPASDAQYGNMHYLMGISFRNSSTTDLATDHARAVMHLQLAAQAGHAQAQRALGTMYEQGLGMPRPDEYQAHIWFNKAAAQGDVLALGSLGKQHEWGRGCIRDSAKALHAYGRAADHGCVPAQLALALLLEKLDRVDEAIPWFERVVDGVDSKDNDKLKAYRCTARLRLALHRRHRPELEALANDDQVPEAHYWLGRWAKAEHSTAAYAHFERAAQLGHMLAQFQTADMLANGLLGVAKDRAAAYHWYTKASAQGHALSQLCEALYHIQAIAPVTTVDLARAESLLRSAVRKGSPDAMLRLAQLLLKKNSADTDAVEWLLKAAAKGNPAAMRELAALKEADRDYNAGLEWLRRAAVEHQDARAWYALAQYYEKGWHDIDHSEPNMNKALECLRKAEALGYIRASFEVALLHERRSQWSAALRQYTAILERFDTTHTYGWHARLAKHRLEVLHGSNISTSTDSYGETYRSLHDMVAASKDKPETVEALELLGICCENGLGIECDPAQAMAWYLQATQVRIPASNTSLVLDQARARCRLAHLLIVHQKKPEDALQHLQQLAPHLDQMKGHASSETVTQAREARYHLGYLLLHHQNEVADAKRWLTEAASQGHTGAMYELGKQAMREDNHSEAKHRFSQGHVMGHASSKRELALLLLQNVDSSDDADNDDEQVDMIKYLLEEAVDMQDTEAMFQLGQLYELGLGCKWRANAVEAYELFDMAGHAGHTLACVHAGEMCVSSKRLSEALDWFRRVPEHWVARFRMALCGLQLEPPGAKHTWFAALCEAVPVAAPETLYERRIWSKACEYIGECFERGEGTDADDAQAEVWYTRSADLGGVRAVGPMHRLAQMHLHRRNDSATGTALEWLRAASEQGDSEAQFQVGLFHKQGRGGLHENLVAAAVYLAKAAAQHHPRATYELADTHWKMGDYSKGWQCYCDAADTHGIVEALRAIGYLYDRGFAQRDRTGTLFSIPQDRLKAIDYFCKAADMNDKASILMLGSYYEKSCLQQDTPLETALAFYEKAAAAGSHATNPVLEFVIGRLFHTMAEHAPALHREAFVRFHKAACLDPCQDDDDHDGTQTDYATANAQIMVALYHLYGWHPPERNPDLGFQMLQRIERDASNDVQRDVKQQIALCYENGIGTRKDPSKALLQWKRLCELGVKHALATVEEYHRDGLATDDELQSARRSFRATQVGNLVPSEEREETASSSASSYTT